jgi:hypothetical protein
MKKNFKFLPFLAIPFVLASCNVDAKQDFHSYSNECEKTEFAKQALTFATKLSLDDAKSFEILAYSTSEMTRIGLTPNDKIVSREERHERDRFDQPNDILEKKYNGDLSYKSPSDNAVSTTSDDLQYYVNDGSFYKVSLKNRYYSYTSMTEKPSSYAVSTPNLLTDYTIDLIGQDNYKCYKDDEYYTIVATTDLKEKKPNVTEQKKIGKIETVVQFYSTDTVLYVAKKVTTTLDDKNATCYTTENSFTSYLREYKTVSLTKQDVNKL